MRPFKNPAEIAVVIINHHLVRAQDDRIGGGGIVNRDRTSTIGQEGPSLPVSVSSPIRAALNRSHYARPALLDSAFLRSVGY